MPRLLAVLVLGCTGAVLVVRFRAAHSSSMTAIGLGALFLIAVVPVVFRFLRIGTTYRQAFASCLAVGLVMGTWFFGSIVLRSAGYSNPWYAHVLSYALFLCLVGFASALAAAVACQPAQGEEPVFRRRLRQVGAATGVFVACSAAVGIALQIAISSTASFSVFYVVGRAAYLGLFFAAIAAVVLLPVMVGLRRVQPWLDARLPLAIVGGILFPVPLLIQGLLAGRLSFMYDYYLRQPYRLFWASLPYALAGAAIGWCVAERSERQRAAVP